MDARIKDNKFPRKGINDIGLNIFDNYFWVKQRQSNPVNTDCFAFLIKEHLIRTYEQNRISNR